MLNFGYVTFTETYKNRDCIFLYSKPAPIWGAIFVSKVLLTPIFGFWCNLCDYKFPYQKKKNQKPVTGENEDGATVLFFFFLLPLQCNSWINFLPSFLIIMFPWIYQDHPQDKPRHFLLATVRGRILSNMLLVWTSSFVLITEVCGWWEEKQSLAREISNLTLTPTEQWGCANKVRNKSWCID